MACHSGDAEIREAEKIFHKVSARITPDSREDLFEIRLVKRGSTLQVSGETTSAEGKNALLFELAKINENLIDSIQLLPDTTLMAKTWGLVNVSVCNIRTGPGQSSEMSTQAILGTPIKLLKSKGSWLMVQTPDRYIGWVDEDAIFQMSEADMMEWKGSPRAIYLPLSGEGFDPVTREAVTDLVAGSILKMVEISKSGGVAELPDGRKIALQAAEFNDFDSWKENLQPTAVSLIGSSKSLTGRPYLWGGTSSKGVDCSGFVKTVFFLNGIILARDASLQFRHGVFTEPQSGYNQLKAGDLVFFGRKADGSKPAKATHVGLYLGDGDYINSSGCVKVDSFDPNHKNFSKIRSDNWLGGRTILGSEGTPGIVRVKDHSWY
jgi:hypothetical protein